MYLGIVIGNVWATRKYDQTKGFKFMFVQPLNAENQKIGEPIVAIDTIGAGTGEKVIYVTASEAVIPLPVDFAPIDASIVGIVDSINLEK
ncbi:MAG: ethanolamine utilization protein EutN [Chlorobiaceae bacterium]|nr:ethanolamine utilization protein EutN [Chlorobiaceae bacterium]MBA4310120.1 ethanolamine utilization protein EutN [Chlorobiaceae bacterium]